MRAFFAVFRRELADAVQSPLGHRIAVAHLGVALLAVLMGWPVAYMLGQARWAPALAWWVYAEILMLSYLAIAIPADALEQEQEIRPGDWIAYGEATPMAVQLGQSFATLFALAFWLLTALPAMLLGLVLSPIDPSRLTALAVFALLLLAALTQIGTWIGVTIDGRPFRIIAVDLAYAAIMLGSLLMQITSSGEDGSRFLSQPLEVAARILNVSALEALYGSAAGTLVGLSVPAVKPAAGLETIPWLTIFTLYGGILLVAGSLSVVILRQWQQRRRS